MKKLTDLDPHWIADKGRHGVALSFECPCGKCEQRIGVSLANPLDGGERVVMTHDREGKPTFWTRTGTEWAELSLTPSIVIWDKDKEHWHGHITGGFVTP